MGSTKLSVNDHLPLAAYMYTYVTYHKRIYWEVRARVRVFYYVWHVFISKISLTATCFYIKVKEASQISI